MIDKLIKQWREWDEPTFWKIVGAWGLSMVVWGMIIITIIAGVTTARLIQRAVEILG